MKKILLTLAVIGITMSSIIASKKEDISFKNGSITLKGTVHIPKGDGPFPAVVFVHGSGPETRDNSSYSAKWMATNGYIALTYDKRGTGKSDGNKDAWQRFNFDSLANDVVAAVEYLESRSEVNAKKIGLFATSQGGWVAALSTQKTTLINFMIMRSVSVTTVGDDRLFERSARLKREGVSASDIEKSRVMQRVEPKRSPEPKDQWTELFDQFKDELWFRHVYRSETPFSESLVKYRLWYATIVDFDPVPFLKKVDIPMFWIFGDPDMDQLSPVELSLKAVRDLEKSSKKHYILQIDEEGHNIKESTYRQQLKVWLEKNVI